METERPALPEEIRRHLESLGLRRGRDLEFRPASQEVQEPSPSLEGRLVDTGSGRCFVVEESYPRTHVHGRFPLAAFLEEPVERWGALASSDPLPPLSPTGLTFLDIETTGLSDGAGTYAFLVGLGRFEGDVFRLQQVFLRSPAEERAFLETVAERIRPGAGLVTFNGRGFDLPILGNRYLLARMGVPWTGQAHLDLLLPARRLWRDRLVRCRLVHLEEHLLGIQRTLLDIPSWRIPSVYHDYLRGAPAEVLRPVFYHNAQDVLSLVALAVHLARFLRDPWGEGGARHGLEFYALGRMYERQGNFPAAIAAYRSALLLALPLRERERAWERLSLLLKREGRWAEALEVWQALLERPGKPPLYACVELAKYYEHRSGDLARAEAVVERAIAEYGERPGDEDLARRRQRLRRKRAGESEARR
ncbi:MAG: ribonuclease H-like domain-containing protein [Chloroflexia bacterium]